MGRIWPAGRRLPDFGIVHVKINNEELFFNAFLFEKFILFYFWIGLDVVLSMGNLSSVSNC